MRNVVTYQQVPVVDLVLNLGNLLQQTIFAFEIHVHLWNILLHIRKQSLNLIEQRIDLYEGLHWFWEYLVSISKIKNATAIFTQMIAFYRCRKRVSFLFNESCKCCYKIWVYSTNRFVPEIFIKIEFICAPFQIIHTYSNEPCCV